MSPIDSTSAPYDSMAPCTQLVQGLSQAASRLHRIKRARALRRWLEYGLSLSALWLAGVVLVIGLCRAGLMAPGAIVVSVACGLFALAVAVVIFAIAASRIRPTIAEVAERLDLSTRGHNRIATALEFSQSDRCTAMQRAAIEDGLLQLQQVRTAEPFTAAAAPWRRQPLLYLVGAYALLLTVLLLPFASRTGQAAPASLAIAGPGGALSIADLTLPSANRSSEPKPLIPRETTSKRSAGTGSPSPGNFDRKHGSQAPAGTGSDAATVPPSGTVPVAQANTADGGEPGSEAEGSGKGEPSRPNGSAKQTAARAAAAAASSAGQTQTPPPHSGGSQSQSAVSRAGDGQPDPNANGGSAVGASASPPSDSSPPPNGAGESNGPPAGQPPKNGSGTSRFPTGSDGSGGNGKSTGESPPKKSRGVAPMMLGTKQPDLFQGKPLPGPDERTRIQVAPQPNPQPPAADQTPALRTGDESPADRYRVPPALRAVVGHYFETFHADPADAPIETKDASNP